MKNNFNQQNTTMEEPAKLQSTIVSRLSDDACYLLVLAGHLKKLLGAASLPHFLATGESVVFTKKAS